jgi:hypothetical protein
MAKVEDWVTFHNEKGVKLVGQVQSVLTAEVGPQRGELLLVRTHTGWRYEVDAASMVGSLLTDGR